MSLGSGRPVEGHGRATMYVAVAETLDAPLDGADGRLARAPGPRCTIISLITEPRVSRPWGLLAAKSWHPVRTGCFPTVTRPCRTVARQVRSG